MNKRVVVHNSVQPNYQYERSELIGKNFAADFQPDLSPQQMLQLGVFDGHYWTKDWQAEFPTDWFIGAKLADNPDPLLNYFGIHASQPLRVWQQKHWIVDQDPLGWFQWYCRYYYGRRSDDDERQIKRWKAIKRHIAQIKKNCRPGDLTCRPKQRQALLHWAYDSRF